MAKRQSQPPEQEPKDHWDHTAPPEVKWPGSPQTESEILGAILLGGSEAFDKASAILSTEDFLLHASKMAWTALVALRERNEAMDRRLLTLELQANGKLELVGGMSWIVSLGEGLPDSIPIESYCRKVKELSNRRRLMVSAQVMLARAQDEGVPIDEVIQNAQTTFEAVQSKSEAEDEGKNPEQVIEAFGVEAFLDPTQRPTGLMTGWTTVDETLNGFHGGELTLLGARPSQGKTMMALNIAFAVCKKYMRPVWFFSLEMSAASLLTRMLCASARVEQHKFRIGFLNHEERRRLQIAMVELTELPFITFDIAGISATDISNRVRKAFKQEAANDAKRQSAWEEIPAVAPAMVIVDFLQLLRTDKAENRNLAVGHTSRVLKLLTRECNIPVIALSQLARPDKTARFTPPDLASLRDSGELEANADNVLFIWREELVRPERTDLHGRAQLIISKQRNGAIRSCPLLFLASLGKFENTADDPESMKNA